MGLPRGALADGADSQDFTFAVVNDVHYVDEKCGAWFAKVLEGMKEHRPDFCLLVGDLVEDGTAKQIGAMKELLAASKFPVHVVVGNHDHTPANDRSSGTVIWPKSSHTGPPCSAGWYAMKVTVKIAKKRATALSDRRPVALPA